MWRAVSGFGISIQLNGLDILKRTQKDNRAILVFHPKLVQPNLGYYIINVYYTAVVEYGIKSQIFEHVE